MGGHLDFTYTEGLAVGVTAVWEKGKEGGASSQPVLRPLSRFQRSLRRKVAHYTKAKICDLVVLHRGVPRCNFFGQKNIYSFELRTKMLVFLRFADSYIGPKDNELQSLPL